MVYWKVATLLSYKFFLGNYIFLLLVVVLLIFFLMLKTPRLEYYADILVHAIVGSCLRKNVRQMQMKFGRSQISVTIHVVENWAFW